MELYFGGRYIISERLNVKVVCPICETEFLTSADSNKTKCPKCDFEFELEQALKG